ncbi:MAG: iron-containing alcohol dehydrogenase [Spirochaetales bacterium]|nr:MAG: iron-containing alcohol dehydrogenase [Spirochaetales bacterium]
MNTFTFYNPTKIVFGRDAVEKTGAEASALGKKALLLYGRSSLKSSGLYGRITSQLKKQGIQYVDFPGVKSNPVLSHCKEAIALAKKEKVDFILAAGGGSVIDEAKGIAAGYYYKGDVWDLYNGKAKPTKALPILAVLTIPATGTEMNGGTVLTNEQTLLKASFMTSLVNPRVSILDPATTLSIPPDYTAYSVVDALSHLFEGYFTHSMKWAPLHEGYVEGLAKTIIQCGDKLKKDPKNYEARETFMWAATLAWNGLSTAGLAGATVPSHALEHSLSAMYDVAHGAGLSIVIPAWMKYALSKGNKQIAKFARNVLGINTGDAKADAEAGIAALKKWFKKIGSPVSFKDAGIPKEDIPKIADNALVLCGLWGLKDYTRDVIISVYNLCL